MAGEVWAKSEPALAMIASAVSFLTRLRQLEA